jgi:hypothetical protein
MSLKLAVVLLWVICLSCKVVMTGCEVVLVNRNIIDSFRVGEDGCRKVTLFVRISVQVVNQMICVCVLLVNPLFENLLVTKLMAV